MAGNPNCGKTSLFNNLTRLKQHVGNYPGVTVEKKEGFLLTKSGYQIKIIDLPGIYSLSANSEDEVVARNVIVEEKPDLIVDVIDSSNLQRNLYLYVQLTQLNVPVIVAMNMADILKNKGQKLDYKKLLSKYGIKAVEIIANKNKGTDKLVEEIINSCENKQKAKEANVDYGKEVIEEINKVSSIIKEDTTLSLKFSIKYLATMVIKQDKYVIEQVKGSSIYDKLIKQAEQSQNSLVKKFDVNIETIFADKIYSWIEEVYINSIKQVTQAKKDYSEKIDSVVLNKWLAIPIFSLVMYVIFKFTFTLSQPLVDLFESSIEWLTGLLTSIIPEGMLQSFVVDGIVSGVGSVLSFFPLILFMFFAIAFFEDTGYMARAVFIMDKLMRKFGLHGKSFASLIIATNGCAVPAMMAARTIENKKDRIVTLMVIPFMICGAKLPIFALFIGAFFTTEQAPNVMFVMYAISVLLAFVSASFLKKTVFKNEPGYFVMELPPYRMPSIKNVLLKMWERGWLYIKKAGTIILFVSIVIWAGLTFPQVSDKQTEGLSEEAVASIQIKDSYIGKLGNFIEPIIKPIGFDGKAGVALIAGLAAKEVVVSTLGTIYSLGTVDPEEADSLSERLQADPDWNKLKAVTFLIFCLIYVPCIVALSVFYRETGSKIKWLLILFLYTTILGYGLSFIIYRLGLLLHIGV